MGAYEGVYPLIVSGTLITGYSRERAGPLPEPASGAPVFAATCILPTRASRTRGWI